MEIHHPTPSTLAFHQGFHPGREDGLQQGQNYGPFSSCSTSWQQRQPLNLGAILPTFERGPKLVTPPPSLSPTSSTCSSGTSCSSEADQGSRPIAHSLTPEAQNKLTTRQKWALWKAGKWVDQAEVDVPEQLKILRQKLALEQKRKRQLEKRSLKAAATNKLRFTSARKSWKEFKASGKVVTFLSISGADVTSFKVDDVINDLHPANSYMCTKCSMR